MQRVSPRPVLVGRAGQMHWGPFLYVAPGLLFLLVFVYWPLFYNIWLSLHDWNLVSPTARFVGLGNYLALLQDPLFIQLLLQSLEYILLATLGNFLLPLALAFLTLQVRERWLDLYQSLLFAPTAVAVSVATLVWLYLYLPAAGPFSKAFSFLGFTPPNFLGDPQAALFAVSLVANWKFLGFHYLIALAGIRALPKEVLEAARVDGAVGWPFLSRVLLPMLAPTLLFLFLSAVSAALDYVFVPIDVMTQGGPFGHTSNLMYAVYQEAFRFFRVGMAAALAVLLSLGLAGFVLAQLRILERRSPYA